MSTDWKSVEALACLIAALIASKGGKDMRKRSGAPKKTATAKKACTHVYIPVKSGRVIKRASKTTSKVKRAGSDKDEA
ncbi:hypothetical protein D6C99_10542 [Aureobasidium pullulans]|nr:hypothetical protein D6D29_10638 [Aureobasidium pullulans]THY28959.1 hypothetical protein D6C99_10542 [Aureobasidium pullulans]